MYQEAETELTPEDGSNKGRPSNSRSIFRSEALDHYVRNQKKVELPRLISVRLFRFLWIIALLLMVAGSLVVFWPLIN